MAERIIGVDFGMSTSVMRVKRYEDGKPAGERLEVKEVMFDGENMVPTLIQKKEDDPSVVYFGKQAKRTRRKHKIYRNFKVDLESADASKREAAMALTEEFYRHMAEGYKSQRSFFGESTDEERTIVSYPVKWSRETKEFMVNAAKKAGFPNVSGTDEAQAAIWGAMVQNSAYLKEKGLLADGEPVNVLLVDMGAGTTDLVLCRYTPGAGQSVEVLTTWPQSGEIFFGGQEVDLLLQEFFRGCLPKEYAGKVLDKVGTDAFKSWKEELVSPALMKNEKVCEFGTLDNITELLEVEMDEYCLDRRAFEECLSGYLKQFPTLVNGCIQASPIDGGDVDLVVVTGGHSQWYFVREMLAGNMVKFGEINLPKIKSRTDPKTGKEETDRIITTARPQETVARGLVYSPMGAEVVSQPKVGVVSQPKVGVISQPKPVGMEKLAGLEPGIVSLQDDDLYLGMDLSKLSREDVIRYYRKYIDRLVGYSETNGILVVRPDGKLFTQKGVIGEEIVCFNKYPSSEKDKVVSRDGSILGVENGCLVKNQKLSEERREGVVDKVGNRGGCKLRMDGTVLTGRSDFQSVNTWNGIVALAGSESICDEHIMGLKQNGTVLAEGENRDEQCNVGGWSGIVAVYALDGISSGLKRDGTVLFAGEYAPKQEWHDVVTISVGGKKMLGLRKDGRVYYCERFRAGMKEWSDIIAIAVSDWYEFEYGLQKDGTLVPKDSLVSTWHDIVAITYKGHLDKEWLIGITKKGEILYNSWRKEEYGFWNMKTRLVPTGTKVIDAHVFDTH